MTVETREQAIRRSLEVVDEEGVDAYLAFIEGIVTPDIEFLPILAGAEGGPILVGMEGVRAYVRIFNRAYPDFKYEEVDVERVGEYVFVVHARVASNAAPDLPPSPRLSMVVEFEEDRVKRMFVYESTANAMADARESVEGHG